MNVRNFFRVAQWADHAERGNIVAAARKGTSFFPSGNHWPILVSSRRMAQNNTVDHLAQLLGSYAGRDKALRALAFYLQLKSTTSPENAKELLGLAKQLSSARLVMRQFNHPSMIIACRQTLSLLRTGKVGRSVDVVDFGAAAAVTGIYTVYGFVELLAWLSDAKLLPFNAVRLFQYCLYMWLAALLAGIIRQLRLIATKGLLKGQQDVITLIGLVCDFVSGANSLPAGVLWAGKLRLRQTAWLSLVASVIGFYKLW
ncbi:unnamed protein product [Caenorhabditis auriculariae]|uniref:Uncharacterized protein n=1 Tax=Caenorhabditis auriculariae TaxID=2777116 RepID=A0A8S1GMP5_9PELO|nr:unnamed protein product [Caenorhabditis auriculariae]